MTIRKAIIPAGGLGTRLRPLTQLMPKEMLPLGGKVVLQYVLEECDRAGLDTVLVVLNRHKTALFPVGEETSCPSDAETGIPCRSVYFANQAKQGGLAHALLHGEAFVGGEHFAVVLGDTILQGGHDPILPRLVAAHLEHQAAATIAAQLIPDDRISRYGVFDPVAEPGEVFAVRAIVEKPPSGKAPSQLAVAARYIFSAEIFAACRACGRNPDGEIELTQAITWLAREGRPVFGVRLAPDEERLDIGNPQSYADAFRRLAE